MLQFRVSQLFGIVTKIHGIALAPHRDQLHTWRDGLEKCHAFLSDVPFLGYTDDDSGRRGPARHFAHGHLALSEVERPDQLFRRKVFVRAAGKAPCLRCVFGGRRAGDRECAQAAHS